MKLVFTSQHQPNPQLTAIARLVIFELRKALQPQSVLICNGIRAKAVLSLKAGMEREFGSSFDIHAGSGTWDLKSAHEHAVANKKPVLWLLTGTSENVRRATRTQIFAHAYDAACGLWVRAGR